MLTDRAPTRPPPSGAALRWAGPLDAGVLRHQARHGRRRRWVYAAAGDEHGTVGAAVVDLGLLGLGTAFAFAATDDGILCWEPGPGRSGQVGGLQGTASVARRGGSIDIGPEQLRIDVPVDGGRLRAVVDLGRRSPVSLLTATSGGGWNATTKAAGHVAAGRVRLPVGGWDLDGGAWTDATDGRQDRHTTWRWAAGAGRSRDGRWRVGLQASTGMNALGPGEDVVWWDDQPSALAVEALAPRDPARLDGPWVLRGPGWALELEPLGARSAVEGLGPLRSCYSQPVGTWSGTLPGPGGDPVPVALAGVAEDHEARW